MKVVIQLKNGVVINLEMSASGNTGVAYCYTEKGNIVLAPTICDINKWLDEGDVLDIRFNNGSEMKSLIRFLLEYRKLRNLITCPAFKNMKVKDAKRVVLD